MSLHQPQAESMFPIYAACFECTLCVTTPGHCAAGSETTGLPEIHVCSCHVDPNAPRNTHLKYNPGKLPKEALPPQSVRGT